MKLSLPIVLLAVALALLGIVLFQAVAPVTPITEIAGPSLALRTTTQVVVPAYEPPPEAQFAVINARPLFDPARHPVAEPEAVGTQGLAPPNLTLIGVAIASRMSVALLKKADAHMATSVPLGQSIDGWKVVAIGPDFVTLHAGVTDFTVKLRAAAGLPQPALNTVQPQGVTAPAGQ